MNYLNKKFKVDVSFGTLCCGAIFSHGEILEVWKHPTINRLYIKNKDGHCHNIKRSTLNRCCTLLNQN